MTLFEKTSENIASSITKELKLDNDKKEVIAYGAYIMLDIILSVSMVMIFGALVGVFFESLIISFTIALLRKVSGGAHADTSLGCATLGTVVAVGFAVLVKSLYVYMNTLNVSVFLFVSFILSCIAMIRLAPVDSPNKRIVKKKKIEELKQKSLKVLFVYGFICVGLLLMSWHNNHYGLLYISLICTGYLWQSFTLTSLGHSVTRVLDMPFRYKKKFGGEK